MATAKAEVGSGWQAVIQACNRAPRITVARARRQGDRI